MAIRLSSTCLNCANLKNDASCKVHEVKVSSNYTCDQFELRADLDYDRECSNCARHGQDDCAHPEKAAAGMLCTSWAPAAVA